MFKKLLTIILTSLFLSISFGNLSLTTFAGKSCEKPVDCSESGQTCVEGECQNRLSEATFDVKNLSLGEDPKGNNGQNQKYLKKENPIVAFILEVIVFATEIIGSIALILLIVAGIMFMASQGNQQTIDSAKDIVKYAVIGLIVTFLSYIITIFVQSLFTSS